MNKWYFFLIPGIFMCLHQCKPPVDDKEEEKEETEKVLTVSDTIIPAGDTAAMISKDVSTTHRPLRLTINNLASKTAPVVVIVYNTKNKFLKPNGRYKRYKFMPAGESLSVQIKDLEYGTFAIAIFQDMNDNGKMDKNAFGIPSEGYAFSNNHKPKVRAPHYDQCKFSYQANSPELRIRLIK